MFMLFMLLCFLAPHGLTSYELAEFWSGMKSRPAKTSETVVSDKKRIGWIGCFDTIPAQIAPACVRLRAAGQVRRDANLPYKVSFILQRKAWKKNWLISCLTTSSSHHSMRKVWTTQYDDITHDSRHNLAGDCPVAMIKVVLWTCNNESCRVPIDWSQDKS